MFSKIFSFFVLFSIISLCIFIPNVRSDETDTTVSIEPASQMVTTNSVFNISVFCIPSIPIKAFELKLYYDPYLLKANSIMEGDIFDDYETFFSSGIINNIEGSIKNVYGLIIGQGNVTAPGALVNISFTSLSNAGFSNLTLQDVGITNETGYLSIITYNGNVTINFPYSSFSFSNITPSNNSVGLPISTSLLSIDIDNINGNEFDWNITTYPNIGSSSGTNETNGTKICNITDLDYQTTYTWFVKCKDAITGQWTNVSYLFTTENQNYQPPGGGGGGYIPPGEEENNPPAKPQTPNGSVFIENGTMYEYSSSTLDVDADSVRYIFDWGDGTFSAWSEYISSNVSVYMNHAWNYTSGFEIKVLAQDEHGLNSSWSDPLEITVSEINTGGQNPVLVIDVSIDFNISNKTIIFDASRSYDPDSVIISYTWDFGDGNFGYGVKVVHTYDLFGIYNVTLMVMDNFGYSYNKSITLNVNGGSKNIDEDNTQTAGLEFKTIYIVLIIVLVFVVLFITKYREKIRTKLTMFWLLKIRR